MLPPGLQQRGAACRRQGLLLRRRERQPLVAGSVATPGGQAVGSAGGYCHQGRVSHGWHPMASPIFQLPTAGWPGDPHESGSPESLEDEQHHEVWGGCSTEATWLSASLLAEWSTSNSGLQTCKHAGLPGLERWSDCGS
jgi:hypothetical protein